MIWETLFQKGAFHAVNFEKCRVAWPGVAWRGVAWRGVALRG